MPMDFELKPTTEKGALMVALAERHAADFATRAAQHDREGSFPFENYAALRESGFLAACVPEELGGLDMDSIYDLAVAINRLGRGDGSTAIASHMHLGPSWAAARAWRLHRAAGRPAGPQEWLLRGIATGEFILCAAVSEGGTDYLHALTEARPVPGGYLITGRKIFGTLSPVATLFTVNVRLARDDGSWELGRAWIPRDTPGVEIQDNWDALGMRASGSNDIVFHDCFVPEALMAPVRDPWGQWSGGLLEGRAGGNVALQAAFLGIAEAARGLAIELVSGAQKGPGGRTLAERGAFQHHIAAIEIDLAAARAIMDRTLRRFERFLRQYAPGQATLAEDHALMKDFQAMKWLVNQKAIAIVDRALTVSGGAGYLAKNPLSRLYRDVRASPFMQPYSPNEAFEYVGKLTLGLAPEIAY